MAMLATGALIGGAVASKKAATSQQQQMQAQSQQSQLDAQQAEADQARLDAEQAATGKTLLQTAYSADSSPAPATTAMAVSDPVANPSPEDIIALKKQLTVVITQCQQAMGMYQRSMQLQESASRSNMGAVVFQRGMEKMMQLKRDKEMQAAIEPAEQASEMVAAAFKKIPAALRVRYPSEMSRVGNVPMETLAVGRFGKAVLMSAAFGNTGDLINNVSSMRKIQENKQAIGRCMHAVNEQIQLMSVVQARLDQDLKYASSSAPQPVVAYSSSSNPFNMASSLPPPAVTAVPGVPVAAAPALPMYRLTVDHAVNEADPAMQYHGAFCCSLFSLVFGIRFLISL